MAIDYRFRTLDVRPVDGWQAAFLYATGLHLEPMPGWLIQEEVEFDDVSYEDVRVTGCRQVVPAIYCDEDHELKPAAADGCFWMVLAPGQHEPGKGRVEQELARRLLEREQAQKLIA